MQFFNSIIPALALCTALVACSGDKDAPVVSDMSGLVQPSQSTMGASDDLKFELEKPRDPGFIEGIDLSDVPGHDPQIGSDLHIPAPMYIEQNGCAYQLDPATLQPIGGPLDLVTHEPIAESEIILDTPSAVEPTPETKYPNTGIFLEDD